jgi:LacI family gluconate utilization system Gnt-I transcriptional repressor
MTSANHLGMTIPRPPASPGRPAERQRLTLEDVAAAAGVSVVTVSRAMNTPDMVSIRTRERIAGAMREIGYVPDLTARAMTTQRSGIVAVLVPTLTDSGFARMMEGLCESLAGQGLQVIFGNTQYRPEQEEAVALALLGRRPDALVLTGTTHTDTLRRAIARAAIPVIETWHLGAPVMDMAVGIDNRRASREIVRHLLATGRRRVAYSGRPGLGNERAAARRQGFLDAAAEAGMEVTPELLIEADGSMAVGAAIVDRLVATGAIDGLACSGDDTAAGAWLRCQALGIPVPQAFSIVGFGDHPVASLLPGGLSTVRIDGLDIGTRTAAMVQQAIAGGRPGQPIIDVGYELKPRGSTIGGRYAGTPIAGASVSGAPARRSCRPPRRNS